MALTVRDALIASYGLGSHKSSTAPKTRYTRPSTNQSSATKALSSLTIQEPSLRGKASVLISLAYTVEILSRQILADAARPAILLTYCVLCSSGKYSSLILAHIVAWAPCFFLEPATGELLLPSSPVRRLIARSHPAQGLDQEIGIIGPLGGAANARSHLLPWRSCTHY